MDSNELRKASDPESAVEIHYRQSFAPRATIYKCSHAGITMRRWQPTYLAFVNTCYSAMSSLPPPSLCLQSAERTSPHATSPESLRLKYAPFCYAYQLVSKYGSYAATVCAVHSSISSTTTCFSTYFITVGRFFQKTKLTMTIFQSGKNGSMNAGGTSSCTFVEGGGTLYSYQPPAWVFLLSAHMVPL